MLFPGKLKEYNPLNTTMEKINKFLKQFGELDKKKKTYLISAFVIIFILVWAFMSAAIITGNFNRSQVRDGKKPTSEHGFLI